MTPRLHWPQSPALARLVALVRGVHNGGRALARLWRRRLGRGRRQGPFTVLVTGATTGIGLEIARALVASPHRLVLTARPSSMARFAEEGIVADERIRLVPLDVVDPASREAAVRAAVDAFGAVDVLVNNAGISYRSVAEHTTDADLELQLATNCVGPMALIRLLLPSMRARRFGRIVNVSSVGGMTAMPTMSAYSASKFALEGASESLWYELRPWGIAVSVVRPGFINSDGFTKVRVPEAGRAALADVREPYHAHYANMGELVGALMRLTFHDAADVAETVVGLVEHPNPPLWVAGTLDARLFAWMRRVLPSALYLRLLYAGLPNIWEWGQRPPPPREPVRPPSRDEAAVARQG